LSNWEPTAGKVTLLSANPSSKTKLAHAALPLIPGKGDCAIRFYEETIFKNFAAHNARYYKRFSTLLRCRFDDALKRFAGAKIEILHLDGLH